MDFILAQSDAKILCNTFNPTVSYFSFCSDLMYTTCLHTHNEMLNMVMQINISSTFHSNF